MPDPTTEAADAVLDAQLRHIAEALVAEAPEEIPPFPDRSLVVVPTARPAAVRRWRVTAVAAAAVAVVAAGVAAVTVADDDQDRDRDGDEAVSIIAADAGLEPAPQRLLLDGGTEEVLPGGVVVPLELAGLDGQVRPLPGGGHVVVGSHPAPRPLPDDDDERTDTTYGLAVVDADGNVEIERDIERSVLLGATDTDAIVSREPTGDAGRPTAPATILAHDLDTGDERVVGREVELDPDELVSAQWTILGGDLITVESRQDTRPSDDTVTGSSSDAREVVAGSGECTLRITDLTTGDESARPLDLGCQTILGLRAAPDGRQAAIAYGNLSGRWPEQRLAVVDLATGTVVQDELLGNDITCPNSDGGCPPEVDPLHYRGMAWTDATTVDVALDDLDAPFPDLVIRQIKTG